MAGTNGSVVPATGPGLDVGVPASLPGWACGGTSPAGAAVDGALVLVRDAVPRQWRSPAASGFTAAVAELVAEIELARRALTVALDAAARHHAELADARAALVSPAPAWR